MELEAIIGNTLEILVECNKKGEVLRKQAPPSIYMVPSSVRDLSPNSFTPEVVAIGPLHRQDKHLQAFEVQKTSYLHNWLHRSGMVPERTLRECVKKVIGSIERIKACYAEPITYDNSELAMMMVIDACFIFEFIESCREEWASSFASNTKVLITHSIVHDLLLIENQIPFFVLEMIWACTILASRRMGEGVSLTKHINPLLKRYFVLEGIAKRNVVAIDDSASAPDHILGFFHKYFVPVEPPVSKPIPKEMDHTAMELDRAGMNFKPNNEDKNWKLAMELEPSSWFQRPALRMPKVYISDDTEFILRNLVVYELLVDVQKYVTSYLIAMDKLIDTPDDVALLVKSEVLINFLGSNEEAANLINNLCKNLPLIRFFYDHQWEEMNVYYNSYWAHTLASSRAFKRTYFSNPWSIIALTAAFALFALTVVQTIFTIRGPV